MILPRLFEISAMSVAMWGHFLIRKSYIGCRTADHIKFRGQQEKYKAHMRKKKIKREA